MKRGTRYLSLLLVFLFSMFSVVTNVSAERLNVLECSPTLCEVPATQTRLNDDPYLVVYVDNSYVTNTLGNKHRYDVYIDTNAGYLGMTSVTRITGIVVKTSINGSVLFSIDEFTQYTYSGQATYRHKIGEFYRSVNSILTSAYAVTTGATVYGYSQGWISAQNFNGTINILSASAILHDR